MQEGEARTETVNGIPTRWFETGEGVPLVLIHGIPTSPMLWRFVTPRIEHAKVYAWEMIGYGDSIPAGRDQDISMAAQAEHLLHWMDELGLERAILGGHDLGGGVAQIAAVKAPKRCLGLFLTNSIGYDSWPIPSIRFMQTTQTIVSHLPVAAFEQVIKTFLQRGHQESDAADQSFEVHIQPYRRHDGAQAFTHQVDHLHTRDTLDIAGRLKTLDVPARIIWGAADHFQKIGYGEHLARDLGAQLERIEHGKHFTPEGHPEEIASTINDLVQEVLTTQHVRA